MYIHMYTDKSSGYLFPVSRFSLHAGGCGQKLSRNNLRHFTKEVISLVIFNISDNAYAVRRMTSPLRSEHTVESARTFGMFRYLGVVG